MRGSGGQFGIVTKFTVNVHPIGDVWGGYCTYEPSQDDKLYAALHEYAGHGSAADPKSAIIFTDLVTAAGITAKLIYYFYDGPAPPTSGPFADFFKIPGLGCFPKRQKYSELVRLPASIRIASNAYKKQLKSNGDVVLILNARAFFRVSSPVRFSTMRDQT